MLDAGPSLALMTVLALAIDRWLGEPPAACHPVVGMGRWLAACGPRLLALPPRAALWAGAGAWALGAVAVTALALGVQALLARLPWPGVAVLLGACLLKPLLAWSMLRDEVQAVETALGDSLAAGRQRLARLVSRDVSALSADEVREAAIETLAENLNDSVVAPLLWFALAGLPGAALYRYANTADAMWGYRGRWEWAGKVAARADDLLSWLPARLSALLLCAAAGRWPGAARLRREAARTPSPNGGWPMGAMALLLGCRLGKPGAYVLNPTGERPQAAQLRAALRGAERAVALLALIALIAGLAAVAGTGARPW